MPLPPPVINNHLNKEEITALDELRKKHINAVAVVSEEIEPRVMKALFENIQNLRQFAIISGALASFSLAFLDSRLVKNENYIIIGVIGLLLTVIFSVFNLNREIYGGLKSYIKLYRNCVRPFDKIISEIDKCR